MFDETKKSVESILSQRLTSPFYGTLIISWLIWNWKIIYLTIFISDDKITGNKIDYIIANCNDTWHLVYYPLFSTAAILLLLPFVTNGAYWLDLIFNKWRVNKKNFVEGKQLLSIEQSLDIREQIVKMENRFETLVSDKNAEIAQLKAIINETPSSFADETEDEGFFDSEIELLLKKIKTNDKLLDGFRIIDSYIINRYSGLGEKIKQDVLAFYISNELIEVGDSGIYKWTLKGKELYKIFINESF